MAVQKITIRTDDVTGASDETVEQFTFTLPIENDEGGYNAVRYSVDASEDTRNRINEAKSKADAAYAKSLARALKFVTDVATVKQSRTQSNSDGPSVREWAREAGYSVGDLGRIPEEVMKAYLSAHQDTSETVAA